MAQILGRRGTGFLTRIPSLDDIESSFCLHQIALGLRVRLENGLFLMQFRYLPAARNIVRKENDQRTGDGGEVFLEETPCEGQNNLCGNRDASS